METKNLNNHKYAFPYKTIGEMHCNLHFPIIDSWATKTILPIRRFDYRYRYLGENNTALSVLNLFLTCGG
jgi:hypothetical protein